MIHPGGRAFDPTLFFQEILAVSEDDDAGVINMDAASKWEELKTRGMLRCHPLLCRSALKASCSSQEGVQEAIARQAELLHRT